MKSSNSPRHQQRIKVMKDLFSWNFTDKQALTQDRTKLIIEHRDEIDQYIKVSAPAWPIDKINGIDLAILRQAVYELMVEKEIPPKVVVDEAVEIAKEYGSESSPGFINGALGKLITDQNIQV